MGVIVELRDPLEDLETKIKKYKHAARLRAVLYALTLVMAVASTYLLLEMETYDAMRSIANYGEPAVDNNSYMQYANGVLKYSRDGIAFLDRSGKEQWNHPCQIETPYVVVNKDTAVMANQGGNDILVFGRKGLKGEIHTTYPIENLAAAENGIVCALLRDGNTPRVICYDAAGNVLVEHKASVSGTGYPTGMALSPDGSMLQISYLCVVDGVEATRVVYFNFDDPQAQIEECQVTEDIYKNTVIPVSFFRDDRTSVLVGDSAFLIYKGADKPVLSKTVELDKEIRSVFYDDRYLGFVLRGSGDEGYEVRLYSMSGEQRMSKTFEGEYRNVKVSQGNVILYDGNKCLIFSGWGIRKFEGELAANIKEIFPLSGINKYMVMSANGMEEFRLVK